MISTYKIGRLYVSDRIDIHRKPGDVKKFSQNSILRDFQASSNLACKNSYGLTEVLRIIKGKAAIS